MALCLAAAAGATSWVSYGTLAVTSDRVTRVGALPPFWTLAALVIAALAAAAAIGLRRTHAWPLLVATVLWLPWLPMAIPAAWLIWEGPLEAAVWASAGAGVLASRAWRSPGWRWSAHRAAWCAAGMALMVSIGAASWLSHAGRIPGGDEPHYLIITQSLLLDGDLQIQNNHDRGDYFGYYQNGLPPDFLQRGQDDEIYSVHAPGVSMLLLPAFAVAGYAGAVLSIAAAAAAAVGVSWMAAFRVAGAHSAAWAGTLGLVASATMLFHSFAIFPDPVGAAIVAAAMALLVRLHLSPGAVTTRAIGVTGALLGLLPWLHSRFAIVAGAFALVLVPHLWRRSDRWPAVFVFAAAPAVLAAGWFAYFQAIYGTPNPAAPYGNSQQNALAWIGTGLAGLTVDQQFGLLAGAPVMAVLPYGLYALARRVPRLAGEFAAIALPYVLVVASFGMWWGGWSAPARFLVCLMPLTVPLLACAWDRLGRAGRSAFTLLVAIGAGAVAARIVVLDGLLVHNRRDGFDLLLDWLSRSVSLPLAFPSVHRSGPELALEVALGWMAVGALAVSVLALVLRGGQGRGARWALTCGLSCVALTAGVALTWAMTGVAAVSPSTSQAEFLRRWDPDRRPATFHLPSRRRVDARHVLSELLVRSSPRAPASADTLLFIPWLPAGEYRLVVEDASSLSGIVSVSIGMTAQTTETWTFAGEPGGDTQKTLRLPSLVHSVTIRGDDEARRTIARLALRPLAASTHGPADGYVIRAARYGAARAFFLDDGAYMEPGGIWTRADGEARFVLGGAPARQWLSVDLQAGPVDTEVVLQAGDASRTLALAPGDRRRLSLPADEPITITTNGGFRPVDVDAQATDRRRLGVRLEFPE
jgi:hypothetical protein